MLLGLGSMRTRFLAYLGVGRRGEGGGGRGAFACTVQISWRRSLNLRMELGQAHPRALKAGACRA